MTGVDKMELPEHEKLREIQPLSQACGEFLDWLSEQGIYLCRLQRGRDEFVPINETRAALLAEHFGIDTKKLEAEKVALLDAQRRLVQETQPK